MGTALKVVAFLTLVYSWRSGDSVTYKLSNVVCASYNLSWVRINECRLKAISRNKTVFNFNATFIHPVKDILTHTQMFKRASGYKPWLFNNTIDACRFLKKPFNPFNIYIWSIYKDFSNINHTCPLYSLILSVIGLNLAECRRDLNRLVNSTLLSVQASNLEVDVEDIVLRILREMFKNKVLQVAEPPNKSKINCSEIITTQDVNQSTSRLAGDRRLLIGQSTRFKLTSIGRAAFKAGIDYKRANAIHKELRLAQQQLILANYGHLLYLIVCFNSNERGDELFPADATILFRVYTSLPPESQALFKQLGFTEAHAARLVKNQSVQGPLSLQLNRLYKVLILSDVLDLLPLPSVASKYNVERGTLQHLISQSIAASSAIVRLCEELEEFWCYKPLFERILHKMDRCGTLELEPLMELPGVKINRARQLYSAGFRSIEDLAKIRPMLLVQSVEHMPLRVATEIVSAAKIILMKKLDHLEEETENLKVCLQSSNKD